MSDLTAQVTFASILRRALVWVARGRFYDGQWLDTWVPGCSMWGIFHKDSELKAFLVSPPAIGAAIRVQHAFEFAA